MFLFLSRREFLQTELAPPTLHRLHHKIQCRNTSKPPFSYISYTILDMQSLFSLNMPVCLSWSRRRHSGGKDIHELKPSTFRALMHFIPHPAYTLNTLQIPSSQMFLPRSYIPRTSSRVYSYFTPSVPRRGSGSITT